MPPDFDTIPPLPPEMLARAFASALDAEAPETAGARIGPYKLLQEIGEGGFGTVWMAEQHEPIRRRVALKIIKHGMDTREVIARFEAERQALALMDHPNIARVFDAGATDAGRPYFAMELVRGVPITRYCDENRLSPEARLRLFITVCQAVQHAHHKGVIHRDLKPSNILVTMHDGVPVPKVIDFGIAKATSAQLTEKTLFTQFHAFIGTPAYTSPEQMEMSGLDVDTRSDVYSLGVLLYELLTGRPPFDPDALAKSGLDAMRRTIREVDPPRPSARLGTLSEADRTSVAYQRGTESGRLSLLLRGDLDWIVMRCLEKDRTRRYETANGLAVDVLRHLSSEPVAARPPSNVYRVRKFIRRHKLGFTASAAVAVALVAGLIASSVLLVRERAAHHRATAAEQQEAVLRQRAETAQVAEVKRAARTALDLANRNLADGRIADGLAYLVYAARKDPRNRTLGPRLASVLTSYNFAIPRAAPLACGSRVLALRFTRDGGSFFIGTADGTFRVMDAGTGAVKRQFQLGREVVADGWQFARANDTVVGARFSDNTFGVYDTATGTAKFPPLQLDPRVGFFALRPVSLSPNGRWIYANAPQDFWLWEADTGVLQIQRHVPERIGGCDFSPTDDTLAIQAGHAVERWSLPAGERLAAPLGFRSNSPGVFHAEIQFSPDGRRLAIFDSSSGQVFDSATGALLRALPALGGFLIAPQTAMTANDTVFVTAQTQCGWWDLNDGQFSAAPIPNPTNLSFAADGQRGVTLSLDGRLRVFETGSSTPVAEPAWGLDGNHRVAISPDGTQVLVGTVEGFVHRFGLGRGAARPLELPRPLNPPLPVPFLPELPARLLVLANDHARVIQVASGREIAGGFRYPEPINAPDSFDTRPPIRADLKFMVVPTRTGAWQSWELGPGGVQRVVPLAQAPENNGRVVFSLNSDLVGLSVFGHPLQVWSLHTGMPIGPPVSHTATLSLPSPNFTADGRRLGAGFNDGAALVFNLETARPVVRLDTAPFVANAGVLFSADGERVVTSNHDGETRLWHANTGEPIAPPVRMTGSSGNVRFSPDGGLLAIWNLEGVVLVNSRTGTMVGNRIPAGGKLVRFSADGNRLGTAGRLSSARVWDAPSGEAVTEPMGQAGGNLPEFSPDGRFLKTETGRFHLWSVPPPLPEGLPAPEWLLELATLCAGQHVNDAGQLVPAVEAAKNAGRLRHQIATLPADAPLADWGRWVLDDRPDRPIAPGFTLAPDEAEALTAMRSPTASPTAP